MIRSRPSSMKAPKTQPTHHRQAWLLANATKRKEGKRQRSLAARNHQHTTEAVGAVPKHGMTVGAR